MKNIEFYRFGSNHYFIDNDNDVEGTIILKEHEHFGETYMSLSHLEFDDDDIEDAIKEAYREYVSDNLYEVVNAGKI